MTSHGRLAEREARSAAAQAPATDAATRIAEALERIAARLETLDDQTLLDLFPVGPVSPRRRGRDERERGR